MYAIVYGLIEALVAPSPTPSSEPPHLENRSPLSLIPPSISPALPFARTIPNPTPTDSHWQPTPPSLKLLPPQLNNSAQPFAIRIENPTPSQDLALWDQPPDLQRHPPELWANQPWNPPLYSQTPTAQWWKQPPDLLKHPPELFVNQPIVSYRDLDTPASLGFWIEPPDLLKHPATVDTNLPQLTFAWQQFPTPTALAFWAEPPDLQRHPPHLDTNQGLDLWISPLTGAPTPKVLWWTEPPDLQWHPPHLDTNQPRLVSQQFATPTAWWWTQPPDLLRHPPELWTPQQHIPPQAPLTPGIWWWTQPQDLLRHATHLDTNQPEFIFAGLSQFGTPTAFGFWTQPPDMLRHATHLDTNESRLVSQQFAEPAVWWWTQPPDMLRHATHLDTNQPEFIFAGLSPFTPSSLGFWTQAPNLLRHAPEMWANEPWNPPLYNQTPTQFGFWFQPTPLPWSAKSFDTQQSARTWEGGETPFEPAVWWWTQPLDLFRHATHLDTNQPVVSYRDLDTPSQFGFFRQPPDTPRRAPELAPAAPYIGPLPSTATPTGFGFWMQPQFQRPRAPDLWTAQPYESLGSAFDISKLICQPARFVVPVVPYLSGAAPFPWLIVPTTLQPLLPAAFLSPIVPHIASGILLPGRDFAITPKALAFYFHSDLQRHPPELFTWQIHIGPDRKFNTPDRATYWGQSQDLLRKPAGDIIQPWTHIVGWRYPFIGSAFIVPRSPLKIVQTSQRRTTAASFKRIRVLVGTKNRQRLPDLQPPIIAGVEQEYVTFDFGQIAGSILSIVGVNCFTDAGPDLVPQTRILNTPSLIPSPTTGSPSNAVIALFGNMVATNLYMLECIVRAADGQELVLEARWSCVSAP